MHTTCTQCCLNPYRCFLFALCGLISVAGLAIGPVAFAQPPSPHRCIPAKGLVAYLEFDGLRTHADAWKKTAAFSLLAETPAGSMMSEVARQVLDGLLKSNAGSKLTGADVLALHEHLMQQGFVIALHDCGDESYSTTIVLKGAGAQGVREPLRRVAEWMVGAQEAGKRPAAVKLRGRDVYARLPKAPARDHDGLLALERGGDIAVPDLSCDSAWYEGGDLVVIKGPDAGFADLIVPDKEKDLGGAHLKQRTAVLDTIDGKQPNVTTHDAYINTLTQGKDIKGFEPDGLFFADARTAIRLIVGDSERSFRDSERISSEISAVYAKRRNRSGVPSLSSEGSVLAQPAPVAPAIRFRENPVAVPSPNPVAAAPPQPNPVAAAVAPHNPLDDFGLSGVTRITGRWGFQGRALFTDLRIEAPVPRKGLAGMIDGPMFVKDQFPPLPRDADRFAFASLDLARAYETLKDGLKTLKPEMSAQLAQLERSLQQTAGLKLREEVLNRLGPWALFRVSAPRVNQAEKAGSDITQYSLLAGVEDSAVFFQVLDRAAAELNKYFRDAYKVPGSNEDDPPILTLERVAGPDRGFRLTSPAKLVSWLGEDQPTILVGKSFVSCALGLERARQALAGESNPGFALKPQGEIRQGVDCLPDHLAFLAVVDDRDSPLPDEIANLPALAQRYALIVGLATQSEDSSASSVLSILGIPRPGEFRVRVHPAKWPTIEQVRSNVFPSVVAATVDERGLRILARDALPFLSLTNAVSVKSKISWDANKGFKRDLKFSLNFGLSK